MKGNLILLAIGLTIGSIFGLIGGKLALDIIYPDRHGQEFETLDDLRQSITKGPKKTSTSKSRSVDLRELITPHPSDLIIYTLRPNIELLFHRELVTTNSFGMRDKEYSLEKPENTLRIALLGDSFAFGWGVAQEKSFGEVMERELNKALGKEKNIQVLNFAVPGYSTFQQVALFKERALQFNPDIVLIFFVENDFGLPFYVRSLDKGGKLSPAQGFEKMRKSENPKEKENVNKILGELDANKGLIELIQIKEKYNFKLTLTINPRIDVKQDEDRLYVLRDYPEDITYIAMRKEFKAEIDRLGLGSKEITLPNDNHPNALRHDIYGKVLADKMLEFISQKISSSG